MTATIEKQGRGVMVGYFPPSGAWPNPLAGVGTPELEAHVTLLYFGKVEEFSPEILAAAQLVLKQFSTEQATLSGSLNGVARFGATASSENLDVIVRLVDVPGLETLREELRLRMSIIGLTAKANHGYIPHTTLAYVDPTVEVPLSFPAQAITLDSLSLAVAGVHTTYPLEAVVKLAPAALQTPSDGFKINSAIKKVDIDRQLVFGWASVSEVAGVLLLDLHQDIITEDDMEDMAYDFVLNARTGGEMHAKAVGRVVESLAFTKEKQAAMGIDLGFSGWWVGFHIEDAEAWGKVKNGEYAGFSIGGTAHREEVTA